MRTKRADLPSSASRIPRANEMHTPPNSRVLPTNGLRDDHLVSHHCASFIRRCWMTPFKVRANSESSMAERYFAGRTCHGSNRMSQIQQSTSEKLDVDASTRRSTRRSVRQAPLSGKSNCCLTIHLYAGLMRGLCKVLSPIRARAFHAGQKRPTSIAGDDRECAPLRVRSTSKVRWVHNFCTGKLQMDDSRMIRV